MTIQSFILRRKLSYCRHCKTDVHIRENKCPKCGTLLQLQRPASVTVIGALTWISGIVGITVGIGQLALDGGLVGSLTNYPMSSAPVVVLRAFGALLIVLGAIYLALAWGYFTGKSWAWILGVGISLVLLILYVTETIFIPSIRYSITAVGILSSIIIIYYLTRPNAKSWFTK